MGSFRAPGQNLGTSPDFFLFSRQPEIRQINPAYPYLTVAHILARAGSCIIGGAALIPEQRGIDSLRSFYPVRLRPWTRRILCRYYKVPAMIHVGGDHIKKPVMIPDGRGEDSPGDPVRS